MKQSLHSIVSSSLSITEKIIQNGGEVDDEILSQLEITENSLETKVDSYSHIISRMKTEQTHWKAEREKLQAIEKGFKDAENRLKESLKQALIRLNKDEIIGEQKRFKLSRAKQALIIDEAKVNENFFDIVQTKVVAKDRIKEELELGLDVEGARFEDRYTLREYVVKGSK